jgi:HEAT repeat protein
MFVILGLAWLAAALVVPFFQARKAVLSYSLFSKEDTGAEESVQSLGRPERAARLLAIYLRAPRAFADKRDSATEMLGWLDVPAAVPPLLRALRDPDEEVRANAAEALHTPGHHDSKSSVSALTMALGDPAAGVRSCAAQTVGDFGAAAESAVPDLIRLLADTDEDVRMFAVSSLGSIGHEIGPRAQTVAPALCKMLADPAESVRWEAADALGCLGPHAIPALIRTLGDPAADVRRQAATTLGQIGPSAKAAVPSLQKMLRDNSPGVRTEAAEAIKKIRGQAAHK